MEHQQHCGLPQGAFAGLIGKREVFPMVTYEELVEKVATDARNEYLEWLASFQRMPEYECDARALREYFRRRRALAASHLVEEERR